MGTGAAPTIAATVQAARNARLEAGRDWVIENGSASADDLSTRVEHRYRIEEILRTTAPLSGRFVELGCFTGIVGGRILEQGEDRYVAGVDVLHEALDIARTRGVDPIHADADDGLGSIEDASFDHVVVADVLQSLLAPERLLDEAQRILRRGGTLVVTTPNFACLSNRILVGFGREPERCDLYGLGGIHPTAFTARSLQMLLERSGFVIDAIRGDVVMPLGDWKRVSQRLWSRRGARIVPTLARNLIITAHKG